MGAPDRTLLITANGQDAAIISLSQQVGSNVLDVKAGVEQALLTCRRPCLRVFA